MEDQINSMQGISQKSEHGMKNYKPFGESLLNFLDIITKWRRFLIWFVGCITIIVTVIALISPRWYKATSSVFPAEQTNLLAGMEGISSLMKTFSPSGRLASLTGPSEAERYMAILKSENALMKVIEKFDLTKVYNITSYPREKTMKELLSNTQFQVMDEGTLVISVYDRDPIRAAEMANYFVSVLNEINSQLQAQNAKGNRQFIEQRYMKNLDDIKNAEEALKNFQLKYGVIAMPEQTEASIKAGAEIYAQLVAKEIELNILNRTMSDSHPSISSVQIEIEEIRKKLKEMASGSKESPSDMKILVPFRQAPQLASDYIRLYREVEIQYKILQFITPLYEQAKVEEQRSTPSVVVLDTASVPERKSKPKVSFYFLLSFVISSLIGLIVIFTIEGLNSLKKLNPEKYEKILNSARSDGFWIKRIIWKTKPRR